MWKVGDRRFWLSRRGDAGSASEGLHRLAQACRYARAMDSQQCGRPVGDEGRDAVDVQHHEEVWEVKSHEGMSRAATSMSG
jgi:hypothetical protein